MTIAQRFNAGGLAIHNIESRQGRKEPRSRTPFYRPRRGMTREGGWDAQRSVQPIRFA
jgi:hypothetical protein